MQADKNLSNKTSLPQKILFQIQIKVNSPRIEIFYNKFL